MASNDNKPEMGADKRFTLFILLSAMILLTHLWWQGKNAPPDAEKKVAEKEEGADGGGAANADAKKTEIGPNDPAKKHADVAKPEDPAAPNGAPPPPKRSLTQASPQWVTLGSLDAASPYRMLVTFNNRGAALERAELNSPRYFDLEDDRGYLGNLALALSGTGKGLVVNAVGAGTPAALAKDKAEGAAGLNVGDVLLAVNDVALAQVADFDTALKGTKAGDEVTLSVSRGAVALKFTATLCERPLEVIRPEFAEIDPAAAAAGQKQDPLSMLLTLESIGSGKNAVAIDVNGREINKLTSLFDQPWEVTTATAEEVEFRFVLDDAELQKVGHNGEVEFRKRFRLAKTPTENRDDPNFKAYHLEMEIDISYRGAEGRQVSYRLHGPNGLPKEGWWYSTKVHPGWFAGAGARDIAMRRDTFGHELRGGPELYSQAKKKPATPSLPLFAEAERPETRAFNYLGVDSQYFGAFLLPAEGEKATPTFKRAIGLPLVDVSTLRKGWEKTLNVSFQLSSEPKTLQPDTTLTHKFRLFIGPKELSLLENYGLDAALEFGWWDYVCLTMRWILSLFVKIAFGSYGIAIVMLTILVRSCMLPVSFKMTKNAQKMQELAPEIKKIRDKYKNDLQKQSQAQQELFRKHGVNMYSGCLLVFLQLPIFAGLYRLLSVDINLRQAPLVSGWEWCSNLAGPDKFFYWRDFAPQFIGDESGYFGPYLNILPIITVTLFLINQKMMTPPATDEQTAMQQKIMSFMMIFFAIMFFKVPSGLCIYFIASSIWTLCEHKVLKKGKLAAAGTTS